jgi:hypothetical protein
MEARLSKYPQPAHAPFMNLIHLRDSIQAAKKRQLDIDDIEKLACGVVADWLAEVILQGKDLISIRAGTVHGEWYGTCERIGISPDKAQRYMRIANNADRIPELKTAGSIRQVLALIAEHSETSEPAQRWPSHVEGITRASKFVGFIERHPFEQWPQEGIQRLREQLLPIASKLWPGVKLDAF